jgi:hypothetical protein
MFSDSDSSKKKEPTSRFLDDTLVFLNSYNATQVHSDPQGKGFLRKQIKKQMFTETNWVIFHSVIYEATLYTLGSYTG